MGLQTPEQLLAFLIMVGLIVAFVTLCVKWLFAGPVTADPWDAALSLAVTSPDAIPLCHRCLTEHSSTAHFCLKCGSAVGEFNNVLPFEQIFSEGEVFRNGTTLKTPPTFLRVTGYFLLSLAAYSIFAPIYWFLLIRNFKRCAAAKTDVDNEILPAHP